MSRSLSIIGTHMSGVRIAGELTFTPAHINKGGHLVHDRVSVPVCANSRYGTSRDGTPGRRNNFKLVAWAGYARSLCKHGSVGKCLDVESKPTSYEGTIYRLAPNPQNPAEMIPQPVVVGGQTLTTEKVAFTITEIGYGEESAKQIQRELEIYASNPNSIAGRPPQWNVMGSPDQAKFAQILDARKKMTWDGQSSYFGYARTIQPRNAQRILSAQERQVIETQGAQALNIPLASGRRTTNNFQNTGAPTAPTNNFQNTGFATGTQATPTNNFQNTGAQATPTNNFQNTGFATGAPTNNFQNTGFATATPTDVTNTFTTQPQNQGFVQQTPAQTQAQTGF